MVLLAHVIGLHRQRELVADFFGDELQCTPHHLGRVLALFPKYTRVPDEGVPCSLLDGVKHFTIAVALRHGLARVVRNAQVFYRQRSSLRRPREQVFDRQLASASPTGRRRRDARPLTEPIAPAMTKRRHGHFCWSCGRSRPNEQFSGRGHAHHVCRDCSKLGKAELEYRQAIRNVARALRSPYSTSRRDRPMLQRAWSCGEDEAACGIRPDAGTHLPLSAVRLSRTRTR
jgi:hypothetical protein